MLMESYSYILELCLKCDQRNKHANYTVNCAREEYLVAAHLSFLALELHLNDEDGLRGHVWVGSGIGLLLHLRVHAPT